MNFSLIDRPYSLDLQHTHFFNELSDILGQWRFFQDGLHWGRGSNSSEWTNKGCPEAGKLFLKKIHLDELKRLNTEQCSVFRLTNYVITVWVCLLEKIYDNWLLLSSPRALRALGLLLADGTPTGGRGEDFLSPQPDFFTETAVTPERKVEKSFPRWEINRHVEG